MSILEIEKKPLSEIKRFQENKMADLLIYLQKNSKFYQKLFSNNNIDIKEIKTLEDLTKIPVTTKDDLQNFSDDFLCIEKNKIVGAVIRDMSAPEVQKEEVVKRLTEVIDKNLSLVQQIGFIMGEGASETERMLSSIIESYKLKQDLKDQ